MTTSTNVASLSAMGDDLADAIGRHLVATFRCFARGIGSEDRCLRMITGEQHPLANFAVLTNAADVNEAKVTIQPLLDCGAPSAAIIPFRTVASDVEAYLETVGFEIAERMPAMAIDIDRLMAGTLPDDYAFLRIGDEEAAKWAQALASGSEIPLGAARCFSPLSIKPDPAPDAPGQFFAITTQGQIVCTSMLALADGLAGIYCVATLPDHRRQGLAACATAEPLRLATRLGYRVGVLQSSAVGEPVYRRLGFESFGEIPVFVRMTNAE